MIRRRRSQKGFTLLETLIVTVLMLVVMGAVFQQISEVQTHSKLEQTKLDLFQESREFMDQLIRDLRDAGYPNSRNFGDGQYPGTNGTDDSHISVGLKKAFPSELWFEANAPQTDGTTKVTVVKYVLIPKSTDQPNCPCLQRGEALKETGEEPTPMVEVQNVVNGGPDDPIFRYYTDDGNEVTTFPTAITINDVDTLGTMGAAIASISTIQVKLVVQSNYTDPKTGIKPVATLFSAMRLHNCSPGGSGTAAMNCDLKSGQQ